MLCVYNNLAYTYQKQLQLEKSLEYLNLAFNYVAKDSSKKTTSRANTSSNPYGSRKAKQKKKPLVEPKTYYRQKQRLRLYMAKTILFSEMNK